ncbi:MAG: CHAT domain-containing protein [Sandaracinaceae bacterium]
MVGCATARAAIRVSGPAERLRYARERTAVSFALARGRRPLVAVVLAALAACVPGSAQREARPAAEPDTWATARLFGYRALVETERGLRPDASSPDELWVWTPEEPRPPLQLKAVSAGRSAEMSLRAEPRGDGWVLRPEGEPAPVVPGPGEVSVIGPSGAHARFPVRWVASQAPDLPSDLAAALEADDRGAALAALASVRRDGERDLVLAAHVAFARWQQQRPDVDLAIAAWRRMADVAAARGVPSEAARGRRAAAYHAATNRRFATAEDDLDRAEELSRRIDDPHGIHLASYLRIFVAQQRGQAGDLRRALDATREAEHDALAQAFDADAALLVQQRIDALSTLGLHERAIAAVHDGWRGAKEGELQDLWPSFLTEAAWVTLRAMVAGAIPTDWGRPRRLLRRAASELGPSGRRALRVSITSNLLWIAHLSGDRAACRSLLAEIRELDPEHESYSGPFVRLLEADLDLRDGQTGMARSGLEALIADLELETGGGPSEYRWQAYHRLALVRRAEGDVAAARRELARAIADVVDLASTAPLRGARAPYLASRRDLFDDAIRAEVGAGDAEQAFRYAEAERALLARSLDASLRVDRLPADERHRFQAALDDVQALRDAGEGLDPADDLVPQDELAAQQDARAARERELHQRLEEAYAILDAHAPALGTSGGPSALRARLEEDAAAALFTTVDERTLGFLLTRSGLEHSWLGSTPPDAWLAERLEGVGHLYVVAPRGPEQALHRVLEGGTHLLDHASLSYLPYVGVLERTHGTTEQAGVLVVADPSGDLPGARQEGIEVAARFGASRLWVGAAVDRARLLGELDGARLFHFAGHGELSSRYPWDAHLRLQGTETLSLEDVLTVRPRLALAVLSGCETGDLAEGTDTLGLASAFVAAGARTVVAADGDLDDAGARRFVAAFYDAGGLEEPAAAYRRVALAQRAAGIDDYASFRVLGLR